MEDLIRIYDEVEKYHTRCIVYEWKLKIWEFSPEGGLPMTGSVFSNKILGVRWAGGLARALFLPGGGGDSRDLAVGTAWVRNLKELQSIRTLRVACSFHD